MFQRICTVAIIVISTAMRSHSAFAGAAEGDPLILSMTAKANEKNMAQIQTWIGAADIDAEFRRSGHDKTAPRDTLSNAEATFAVDLPLKMKRWHWSVKEAHDKKEDGTLVNAPEMIENRDEMVRPDGYFEYAKGFLPAGSDQWHRSLVIWPAIAAGSRFMPHAQSFDPIWYMYVFDRPVSEYLKHLQDLWPKFVGSSADLKVVRSGDAIEITYTINNKNGGKVINRTRYDLARGANLTEVFADGMGASGKTTIDYVQLNGVWVPSVVHYELINRDRDNKEIAYSARTVRFVEGQINTPLNAKDFTPQKMGVVVGARVTDQRNSTFYLFDDETHARPILNAP